MNENLKCFRILVVGLGVFFVVGNFAFNSNQKKSGFKASVIEEATLHRFLGASAFHKTIVERYEQQQAEAKKRTTTVDLKLKEPTKLKVAIIHAGDSEDKITALKKQALVFTSEVLKADSQKGIWGGWIFTDLAKDSAAVQAMLKTFKADYPELGDYLYIRSLKTFKQYTENGTLQNTSYNSDTIRYNLDTLYQTSAQFADKADIIVVLGKAVQ